MGYFIRGDSNSAIFSWANVKLIVVGFSLNVCSAFCLLKSLIMSRCHIYHDFHIPLHSKVWDAFETILETFFRHQINKKGFSLDL